MRTGLRRWFLIVTRVTVDAREKEYCSQSVVMVIGVVCLLTQIGYFASARSGQWCHSGTVHAAALTMEVSSLLAWDTFFGNHRAEIVSLIYRQVVGTDAVRRGARTRRQNSHLPPLLLRYRAAKPILAMTCVI